MVLSHTVPDVRRLSPEGVSVAAFEAVGAAMYVCGGEASVDYWQVTLRKVGA